MPEEPQRQPQGGETPPPQNNANTGDEDLYTSPNVATSPSFTSPPSKKKHKGVIALVIVAVVLVLLIVAGVVGWLWYQHPQKVMQDAISHAIESDSMTFGGSVEMTGQGDSEIAAAFAGQWQSNKLDITVDATLDGQDTSIRMLNLDEGSYVQVENVPELLSIWSSDEEIPAEVQNEIVNLIGDKWISFTSEAQGDTVAEVNVTRECVDAATKAFFESEAQQNEVRNLYREHPVFATERVGREAINDVQSYHFEVRVDETNAEQFFTKLENTSVAQALQECESEATPYNYESITEDLRRDNDATLEVWVSQWAHELTQLRVSNVTDTENFVFTMATTFNEEVDFPAAPADEETVTLEEVFTAFLNAAFAQALAEMEDELGSEEQQDTPDGADVPDPMDPSDFELPDGTEIDIDADVPDAAPEA